MKKILYNLLHFFYYFFGAAFCNCVLMILKIRDCFNPPKEESILFVAHPDDDALFFNNYIEENKPYVVLLFSAWSFRRIKDFFKVMKYYGVRFRVYASVSKDAYYSSVRRRITERHISSCLKIGQFNTIVTHNSTGEYGHPTHMLVHECVVKVCADKPYEIICPVSLERIGSYPLTQDEIDKKHMIFQTMYKSESWVETEEEAGTPIWFFNEKLEKFEH